MNTAYLPSDTVTEAPEVVINEVQTADVDWIELYNPTLETADISGWTVRDSDDDHVMVMPSGSTLKPGAFLSISQGAGTLCEPYTFSFGLGDDDMVRLFNPRGQLVDVLAWEAGQTTEGMSVGRSPDGGDRVTSLSSTTQGAPNAAPISP